MRRIKLGWIVSILALCLVNQPVLGIVLTEDPSLHEVTPGTPFSMVGYLNTAGGTSGVLIGPRQVLTVNHAVPEITNATFSLDTASGRQTWAVESKAVKADMDLAVLTLSESTGLDGVPIYDGTDEQGHIAAMVGYGYSGIGSPDRDTYPIGTAHVGYSLIDYAVSGYIVSCFYAPGSSESLDADEGAPAKGDSGGGIFIQVDGEWVLAGLHRMASDSNSDGLVPTYGDWARGARLSQSAAWLEEQSDPIPEPSMMALLTVGGLIVTVRRRAQ